MLETLVFKGNMCTQSSMPHQKHIQLNLQAKSIRIGSLSIIFWLEGPTRKTSTTIRTCGITSGKSHSLFKTENFSQIQKIFSKTLKRNNTSILKRKNQISQNQLYPMKKQIQYRKSLKMLWNNKNQILEQIIVFLNQLMKGSELITVIKFQC